MQIQNLILKLSELLEGAAKGENPTPAVGPLAEIALHIHTIGCAGIQLALDDAEKKLSLRRFDNETDAAVNTAKIQKIRETKARLQEICQEHHTSKSPSGPGIGDPPVQPPIKPPSKADVDYQNTKRLCDKDGSIGENIKWNERRLDDLLSAQPRNEDLIKYRASKLAEARAQLCPCLNKLKHTAQIAGDKGLESQIDEEITYYCKSPSWLAVPPDTPTGDDKSGSLKENSSGAPPVKTPKLGEGAFKSIQPGPDDETGKGQTAYLPPVAGQGSTILTTVIDPNEEGPHGVVIATVDETGKRNFFKGMTDTMGKMAFLIPVGTTAVDIMQLAGGGPPKSLAHTQVGAPAHIPNTEPVPQEQIPSPGPAITEMSTIIERGASNPGTVILHTQGTDPLKGRAFIDDQPMSVLAASDTSVVAQPPTGVANGPHSFSVDSGGVKSNAVQSDLAAVHAEPIPTMHTGGKANVVLHVEGVPAEHNPVVHFEVTGAARLATGAASADVPVKNGIATVAIQGVHPGQVVVNYQLRAMVRGNGPSAGTRLGKDIRPADYTMMDGIVREYLRKQGENPNNWRVTSKNGDGGLTYTSSNGSSLSASFDRGQIVIR